MNNDFSSLPPLLDHELLQVTGGGQPAGSDQNRRILGIDARGLGGAMAGGAVTGFTYGAAGGPGGMGLGAAGGSLAFGMAFLTNELVTRGGQIPAPPPASIALPHRPIGPLPFLPPRPPGPGGNRCTR